jgi:hypothetical protein
MENRSVVKPGTDVLEKILDGLGCAVGIQLQSDRTHIGFHYNLGTGSLDGKRRQQAAYRD